MITRLDPQVIIDRVSEIGLYKDVRRATNLAAALKAGDLRTPAAFVLDPAYNAFGVPDGSSGNTVQMHQVDFGIITAGNSERDQEGEDAAEDCGPALDALWQSMFSWQPDGVGGFGVSLRSSRPYGFIDQTYFYIDTFTFLRRVRAP